MFYETFRSRNNNYFEIAIGSESNFPTHLHSSIEIIYIIQGEVISTVNNNTCILHKHDVAVCLPFDIHSYTSYCDFKYLLITLSPEYIFDINNFAKSNFFSNAFFSCTDNFSNIIDKLYNSYLANDDHFVYKGYLYLLFAEIKEQLNHTQYKYSNESIALQKALIYINNNFDKEISLNIISYELKVSRTYLSKLINRQLNMSFSDYLNLHRISKAKDLLLDNYLNITEIALECGYDNSRTFDRAFKKIVGKTPKEFKYDLLKNNPDKER